MPTKEFYLQIRSYFILLGFQDEVKTLDNHYELVFIYSKENQLIKII